MTRALLLAIGLIVASPIGAATTTGSIAVSLTIFSRCDISRPSEQTLPSVDCGRHFSAQPRVTQSVINRDASRRETARLVTIEW
ncbi:hypothetical protein [Pantoea dispersa]|uniref:Uncharacterized protein n=1 Tax=Pantoea dispersa TaxID=59814 RepID=A0A8E1V869_9GAMM|nr:hypothetical protein [Pantoea dispersa]KTR88608.1 hypothetical protein SA2_17040 [Pantoea dispersa]KTS22742.1 hypothetical protein SA4R_10135 [Pantoea dispersa]KTS63269.1 hypothetical protein SA5R_02835 [Pantoea dispersa]KTS66526.1 hypothetical protein SA3R_15765 [Pantoea dispersa]